MVRTPNLPTREDMRRRTKPKAKSLIRKAIKLVRRDMRKSKRNQRRPKSPKKPRLLNKLP
jgi:hypothetical protein